MAQLTQIGFENFRVFEKEQLFDFSQITILTGTNGSGKSSVFKGLLLLKNSIISNKQLDLMIFNKENNNLGEFDTVKNNMSNDETIQFSLVFDFTKKYEKDIGYNKIEKYILTPKVRITLKYKNYLNSEGQLSELEIVDDNQVLLHYDLRNEKNEFETAIRLNINYLIKLVRDYLEVNKKYLKDSNNEEVDNNINAAARMANSYFRSKIESTFGKTNLELILKLNDGIFKETEDFNNWLELFSGEDSSLINDLEVRLLDKLSTLLFTNKLFKNDLDHIVEHYYPNSNFHDAYSEYFDVVTNRNRTELNGYSGYAHFGLWSIDKNLDKPKFPIPDANLDTILKDEITSIFETSKNSIDAIIKEIFEIKIDYIPANRAKAKRVYLCGEEENFLDVIVSRVRKSKVYQRDPAFLNRWLKEFGIADSIRFDAVKDIAGVKIIFVVDGKDYNIVDMGHGVTQILPLILSVYINNESIENYENNPPRNIVLVEEPETNLHPALQSKLADFFVEATHKFKVKYVIETHSEYLIRKLQYLTATDKIKPDDSNIYYFNSSNTESISKEESIVKLIKIKSNGFLNGKFGPGFYDQSDKLYLDLFTLNNVKDG